MGRLGSSVATVGKVVAGLGAVAVTAAGGLAYLAVKGIQSVATELGEAQAVSAETVRVLESMGATSWTTAEQVGVLAERISELTGVDDEAVQGAANLVATFGEVQNRGEGVNAVFDRAVGLSVDLARVMGTDVNGEAIRLGKALNDPIKGITALNKAGVTFSQDQKATIKRLVETGDILGAQKVILAEVEKQVGGAAEAYRKTLPGALQAAQTSFGNLKEAIGTAFEPAMAGAVNAVANFTDKLKNTLAPAFQAARGALERAGIFDAFNLQLNNASMALTGAVQRWVDAFVPLADRFAQAIATGNWEAFRATFAQLVTAAMPNIPEHLRVQIASGNWEATKAELAGKLWELVSAGLDILLTRAAEIGGKLGHIFGVALTSPEFRGAVGQGVYQGVTGEEPKGAASSAASELAGIAVIAFGAKILASKLGFSGPVGIAIATISIVGPHAFDVGAGLGQALIDGLASKFPVLDRMMREKGDEIARWMRRWMENIGTFGIPSPMPGFPAPPGAGNVVRKLTERRQHGGPVWPGGAYMVGESGRELFLPGMRGMVLPNALTERLMALFAKAQRLRRGDRAGALNLANQTLGLARTGGGVLTVAPGAFVFTFNGPADRQAVDRGVAQLRKELDRLAVELRCR